MDILINNSFEDVALPKVDLILTDPPYGITQNKWDTTVEFVDSLWDRLKDNGMLVCTCSIKYAVEILKKHTDKFSHDLIWQKTLGSGQLNISRQPLRTHELILVFKKGKGFYNRVKTKGTPYKVKRDIKTKDCYGVQKGHTAESSERDKKSVIQVKNPRVKGGHPTEKPIALWEELATMYAPKGGIILDPFSGSSNILDLKGYSIIAIEKEKEYYELARNRRTDRILEEEHGIRVNDEEFIFNVEDCEYTVFSSKS